MRPFQAAYLNMIKSIFMFKQHGREGDETGPRCTHERAGALIPPCGDEGML